MKKITKITGLLAALLILLCFVSCKQNAASTSEPNFLVSFKGFVGYPNPEDITLSFFDDASFTWGTAEGSVKGSYTGDVTKDGEGTLKLSADSQSLDYGWEREGDNLKLKYGGYDFGTLQKQ